MPHCEICGAKADSDRCFRHKQRKPIRTKKERGAYFDVYRQAFGYDEEERPICEITGKPADQIHHMEWGRHQDSDRPENLIALIFELHHMVETRHREANELLKIAHERFTKTRKPLYKTDPQLCSTIMAYLST